MTDPICHAGLDVSMEETHLCEPDQNSMTAIEGKTPSTPAAIAKALHGAPFLERVVFEPGRMAPTLYHGLGDRGLPAVCIESS